MMGFSAGAELTAAAAVLFPEFDKENNDPSDRLAAYSSRVDFVGIIYPGPSPFAPNRTPPPIPRTFLRHLLCAEVAATKSMPSGRFNILRQCSG